MNNPEKKTGVRAYHQAQWDEPILFELNNPAHVGIEVPAPALGDGCADIPEGMLRKNAPALPRIGQARVLRHYLRLSQENLGADLNVEIGQGTCTMKYSPIINERLARSELMAAMHPLQPEKSAQGILEILYRTKQLLREISGMDEVSLEPQSGSQALMTLASLMRAYHDDAGHPERNELITTTFSHPSAAASAIVKGFTIRTVRARADGYPDFEHLLTLVSDKTAGFICANPEDSGLYNGDIRRFTELIHARGGLCGYDQANANGLFGVTRAKEAGFDMCFFNLHKSFSTPHGCGGPGTGAVATTERLAPFLPAPLVQFDGEKYALSQPDARSIGKVRMFGGASQVALKAYAWMRALGAEGLYEVARTAVLNNNYLYHEMLAIPGVSVPFDPASQRVEQCRYSLEGVFNQTGVTSEAIGLRLADYGFHYWTSHHPFIVPNPATLEPTESPSKEDIDAYLSALRCVIDEAHTDPELVKSAPHNCPVHKNIEAPLDDPESWAITWRAYRRKVARNG
ncbi:MAG: aminomethyl-transferring glycine dehydrogenase subunit GcvPB [Clostridia bacterium]